MFLFRTWLQRNERWERKEYLSLNFLFLLFIFPWRHIGLVSQPTKKEEGELLAFDDTPLLRPSFPCPSFTSNQNLFIDSAPTLFKRTRESGRKKKLGVEGIVYVVTTQMAASFNGFLKVKENFRSRSHSLKGKWRYSSTRS